jgi:hypothetical protein
MQPARRQRTGHCCIKYSHPQVSRKIFGGSSKSAHSLYPYILLLKIKFYYELPGRKKSTNYDQMSLLPFSYHPPDVKNFFVYFGPLLADLRAVRLNISLPFYRENYFTDCHQIFYTAALYPSPHSVRVWCTLAHF